jgi:diaminohydroxyphosphoribosylaminopyrimidine deaminase/5-amino-6-(5-phosphoribosylamino)uracil reductase
MREMAADETFMDRALDLAARGRGLTSPNPMVGAVVVSHGQVVGEGWHRQAGARHAEAEALVMAGERSRDGTLYVTLEPCNHHGRTPPCVEAVLASGVRRVVVATRDPNPRVRGGGLEALRQAGLEVVEGCREAEARQLNRAFLTAMRRQRPHVTLKCAMTFDGKIAAVDGQSRWITGGPARALAHRLRSESDAVTVGIGTALADDPQLTVRLPEPWPREPLRIVVDSRGRLPVNARVLSAGTPSRTVIAVTDEAPADRLLALEAGGACVLRCKRHQGRVDLPDLCARLFAMDVIALLLEGGAELNAGFLGARLVDRAVLFVAPILLGGAGAPSPVGGPGLLLSEAVRLKAFRGERVGEDWMLVADVVETA